MNIQLSTEVNGNGNKVLKVKAGNARAFSIQTNQNLPIAHSCSDITSKWLRARVINEVKGYVSQYGTPTQKTAIL